MTFELPAGLAALGALPLIWWLHRRRGPLRRQVVPSLAPWLELPELAPLRRRHVPPSLRLWLHLAVTALLALALAGPRLASGAASGGGAVVLLDTTTSMAAEGRWAQALAEARGLLDGPPGGVLITAGARSRVAWRAGASLEEALAALRPAGEGDDVAAALGLAAQVAPGVPAYLITDGGLVLPAQAPEDSVRRVVGQPGDNVAVLALSTDEARRWLFARLAAFTETPRAVTYRLELDDMPPQHGEVELEAGELRELQWRLPPGTNLARVALDVDDALAADDHAVLQITEPAIALQWAALDAASKRALRAVPGLRLHPGAAGRLVVDGSMDVTWFHGLPAERPPPGGLIVVDPPAGRWRLDTASRPATVTVGLAARGLAAGLELAGAQIVVRGRPSPPAWAAVQLWAEDRPVMWSGTREGRRIVVAAFDPSQGDLFRRPAFPLLVERMVSQAAARPPSSVPVGARLRAPGRLLAEGWHRLPDGQSRRIDGPWLELWPAGAHRLEGAGLALVVDARAGSVSESDLRSAAATDDSASARASSGGGVDRLAPWLLAAALLLMVGEALWLGPSRGRP